jgi:hypothetical protein
LHGDPELGDLPPGDLAELDEAVWRLLEFGDVVPHALHVRLQFFHDDVRTALRMCIPVFTPIESARKISRRGKPR